MTKDVKPFTEFELGYMKGYDVGTALRNKAPRATIRHTHNKYRQKSQEFFDGYCRGWGDSGENAVPTLSSAFPHWGRRPNGTVYKLPF